MQMTTQRDFKLRFSVKTAAFFGVVNWLGIIWFLKAGKLVALTIAEAPTSPVPKAVAKPPKAARGRGRGL